MLSANAKDVNTCENDDRLNRKKKKKSGVRYEPCACSLDPQQLVFPLQVRKTPCNHPLRSKVLTTSTTSEAAGVINSQEHKTLETLLCLCIQQGDVFKGRFAACNSLYLELLRKHFSQICSVFEERKIGFMRVDKDILL